MALRRIWDWLCGLLTLCVVAGPPLSLALATVIDRSNEGLPRLTAFPLALAASDPTVWEAARNSLIVAASVAAVSMTLGVMLARAATIGRFPGCRTLTTLALSSGLVLPFFAALGLLGLARSMPATVELATPWSRLIWAELVWSIPRVALAVSLTLRAINPVWEDTAKLAGASARRRWKTVVWPLIRPTAARATADVFLIALLEPGAPLVLNLRRTLAFQAVEAATLGNNLQRAAALGGIGWILAIAGRGLIRAWGGPSWPLDGPEVSTPRPRASWLQAITSAATLLAIGTFGLIPIFGLLATSIQLFHRPIHAIATFRSLFHATEFRETTINSLILGGMVAAFVFMLCGNVRQHPRWRRLALSARLIPPLIFGIGLVAMPALLRGLARILPQQTSSAHFLAIAADQTASDLDAYGSPWLVLALAITAVRLPDLARKMSQDRGVSSDRQIEVARTLGASPLKAWITTLASQRIKTLARLFGWTFLLAALDAAPVFVLSPTSAAMPVVPGILEIVGNLDGLQLASAFALLAVCVSFVARVVLGPAPSEPE